MSILKKLGGYSTVGMATLGMGISNVMAQGSAPAGGGASSGGASSGYKLPLATSPNFGSGVAVDTLENTLPEIATKVINLLLIVAGILAVIFLIWSGYQYITSAGNPDKAKVARQGIINAVIGIIVIVAAYFIVRLAIGGGNTLNKLG